MAETRKTTKSKTSSAKTTKKPAAKPANKTATKPKTVKTAKTTATTTSKPSTVQTTTTNKGNASKGILITIIIVAIIAVVAGVVMCVVNGCMQDNATVMIENGKGEEVESKYVSLEDYKYRVLVPTSFKTLSKEEIAKDYGTTDAPELVFANADNTVNVAFSKPNNALKNDEVEEYLKAMKTILSTSMDVISADMTEKDGHKIGILKLVSKLEDEKIYNQMAFFSYDDKLAIVTFNCRDNIRGEWEKVGSAIIDSIKF